MWQGWAAMVLAAGLAACAQTPGDFQAGFEGQSVFGNLHAQPQRAGAPTPQGLVPIDGSVGVTATFPAEGGALAARPVEAGAGAGAGEGGEAGIFTLNFDNAPLADVVRAVLSGALGENYSVNGDLSGRVTLSSERPVRREELLSILENLLAGEGFSLVRSAGTYRIEPTGLNAGAVDRGRTEPGYGITVVPLRFVSVETMNTILNGFVAADDMLRINAAENAVLIRGPSEKRREAAQAVLSFDADWMAGQTVAIFQLVRADPEAVVTELDQIFASGEEGAAAGAIEFKAIPRLKAVMAVSPTPALVRRASTYVRRLDVVNPGVEENVFVFRAQHRNAAELARVVTTLFQDGALPAVPERTSTLEPFDDAEDEEEPLEDGEEEEGPFDQRFSEATSLLEETNGETPAEAVIDLTTGGRTGEDVVRISADVANNAVVVYADGATAEKILATLKALDATPVQVAINVTIAEVRLTDQLEYGVQYFVKSQNVGLGDDNGSVSLFSEVANTLQKQIPGFNFVIGSNANPDVIISALDAITDVEILSSPSLVVVENDTASLQVGDSVPVTVRQAQSVEDVDAPVVNQVEFRDTGIILEVSPRIGENDAVTMRIAQEISAVTGDAGSLTPTFSRRRVASSISVQNGQTVLLAGLISATKSQGNRGIPVLKDVPAVGKLFSTTENSGQRTELVVLIRPTVIRSGEDARSVAEELRSRTWSINGRTAPVGVAKR